MPLHYLTVLCSWDSELVSYEITVEHYNSFSQLYERLSTSHTENCYQCLLFSPLG